MHLRSTIIGNISEVCSEDWDALAGTGPPFLGHAFLEALERHGCVGERWGWLPRHLLLHDGERLVGAMPQYLKTNSYGELVFDWDWAEAYRRRGPVLRQGDIDECRAPQTCPGKAPFAGNGCSISKNGNAVWARLGGSLRARREEAIHGVAPLGKGATITCETRLVANLFPARCIHQYHLVGVPAYYPKLVAAVPYTPATGARLLIAPDVDREAITRTLIEAAISHAKAIKVSSLHWLFPNEIDCNTLAAQGLLIRTDCQFHWHNQGYRDFEHYLGHFTSAKRKTLRRERRRVQESGISIRQYYGEQLSEAQWQIVHRHYAATFARLGGHATLSLAFFRDISQHLPGQVVIFLAEQAGRPVASAICLRDKHSLYGRHWGCDEHFDNLHFELCYYQGLDYCIRHGLQRFDPGAQGEHKISRGFLPTATWSAHWIAHPEFRSAIADFLQRETRTMQDHIKTLGEHTPFKRNY